MAYSDHGYGRHSLRAGGAASRKPGVLGRLTLRRTVQVRFGANPAARLSGGTTILVVAPGQFIKHPG